MNLISGYKTYEDNESYIVRTTSIKRLHIKFPISIFNFSYIAVKCYQNNASVHAAGTKMWNILKL